jgi:hypothetical protein
MENTDTQLSTQSKRELPALVDSTFGGAFTKTGKPIGAVKYVASKLGVSDRTFSTMKELREACGKDKVREASKALHKAKTQRAIYWRQVTAILASDPNTQFYIKEARGTKEDPKTGKRVPVRLIRLTMRLSVRTGP